MGDGVKKQLGKVWIGIVTILLLSGAAGCGVQSGQDTSLKEEDSSSGDKDGTESLTDYDVLQEEQEHIPLGTDEQIKEAIQTNGLWGQILGERIYEIRRTVEDAADFCGEWKRTQIHTGTDKRAVFF